jgi:tryptophanyl-tRNA synthetase
MNLVDNYDNHNRSKDNINKNNTDFKVTPWEVEGGDINYGKLIEKFGTQPITPELLQKIKSMTGEIHPLLKTGYFFSHRDLDWILDKKSSGESFYLYTGRGPSGMVHMGHLMPWIFTKYLQDKFDSKLLFQLTDDEKFLYGPDRTMKELERYTYENILDIIAIGFNPKKTKILVNTRHIQHLYPIAIEVAKRITFSTARAVFGFSNSTNIGMIGFPPVQAAPCFLPSVIEGKSVPV